MREIKFRALSICRGERWVYGDLRHYARNPHTEKWTIHDPATGLETDIEETTIGQFTGLYDKNGKEIYEGDIIGGKARSEDKMILHLVFYEDSEGRFKAGLNGTKNRYDFGCCGLEDKRWMQRKTIIGNIYDNPEMLKE